MGRKFWHHKLQTVVYYGATWATFKPKLEKIKKILLLPENKFLCFRKLNSLAPKKLNKTFFKLSSLKKFNKKVLYS